MVGQYGTHVDPPAHFADGGLTMDKVPLKQMILPLVVFDATQLLVKDPNHAFSVSDIKAWERRHGRIPDESMVIIWTGWDARWGTDAYFNFGADGAMHQPGFALDTVQWLVDTGRLGRRGGTGTDTFSPDVGTDTTYAVSLLVYQRHRISLEVLANLAAHFAGQPLRTPVG